MARLRSGSISGLAAVGLLTALLAGVSAHAAPEVGDPAPDFSLQGSDGRTYDLTDLKGSWVVIAFFPKAFTGG